MSGEQPTGDAGASVTERLETLLSAGEAKNEPAQDAGDAAPEPEKTEVEAPAGDAQDEADGPQLNLSDVAKVLGLEEDLLDVDEDGSLKIKTKIDGKEGAAKLQDFIKSYQLQGHIDEKARKVAEQEKAHVERVSQIEQFAQGKLHELEAMSQAALQMLANERGQVDWDRLIVEDPHTYHIQRHHFERRQAQVGQFLQALQAQKAHVHEAIALKNAQELQREAQRLTSMVPEWADSKVREAEQVEMRQWLQSQGVNEASINAIRDAGIVAVLRSAFKAQRNAPKVAEMEKKVRAAPKLVKPGAGTTSQERMSETVRGLKEQIRKSGGKQGIAEYLIATGKV